MDLPTNYTSKFKVEKKPEEWWQAIGREMKAFGFEDKGRKVNPFWIFWKFSEGRIMRAWHIAQKEGDHDFTHFMNNIYKA